MVDPTDPFRRRLLRLAFGLILVFCDCTAARAQVPGCGGDIDADGQVTVNEIVKGISVALGIQPISEAVAFDRDGSGTVTVDEVVTALNHALSGCPLPPPEISAAGAVETSARVAVTAIGAVQWIDFGYAGLGRATRHLKTSRQRTEPVELRGGGGGPQSCAGGGTRQVSCVVNGGSSVQTEVFSNCTEIDSSTSTTVTWNGTRIQTVATASFCDTGIIPPGAADRLELRNFRVQFACEADCPPGLQEGRITADAFALDRRPAGDNLESMAEGDLLIENTRTGERFEQEFAPSAFRVTQPARSSDGADYKLDGTLQVGCLGALKFETTQPIAFAQNTKCPAAGAFDVSLPPPGALIDGPALIEQPAIKGAGGGTGNAGLTDSSFRAANGQVYQVLQNQNGDPAFGTEDFRITTVAGSATDLARCDIQPTGRDAEQVVAVLASDALGPDRIFKSPIIGDASAPCFNPDANDGEGRICIGPGCGPDCSCPAPQPCSTFSIADGTPLSASGSVVPAAQLVDATSSVSQACESLAAGRSTLRFGDGGPTTEAALCSPEPGDGFVLPTMPTQFSGGADGSTLVLAYEAPFGSPFLTGSAAFPIDRDGENPFDCDAGGVLLPGRVNRNLRLPPRVRFDVSSVTFDFNADLVTDRLAATCEDPRLIQCIAAPLATPTPNPACAPLELGSPLTNTRRGETAGRPNRAGGASCGGGGNEAPDFAFHYKAPRNGFYIFDTIGSDFDTVLYARAASCSGLEMACNDDLSQETRQSEIGLFLGAGQVAIVVVDGFATESGSFVFNVRFAGDQAPTPTPTPTQLPIEQRPDLTITELQGPQSGFAGASVDISAMISNAGTGNADGFLVDFFFSTDEVFSDDDVASGFGCAFGGLGGNSGAVCRGAIGIPADLPTGTYRLIAVADAPNAIDEADEANNTRAADTGPIQITGSNTRTPTFTPTISGTPTQTATRTLSGTPTRTISSTPTRTATLPPTATETATPITLVVTNRTDANTEGTLRRVVLSAPPGAHITFAVTGVIDLVNGDIPIGKDLSIVGPGSDVVTIQADGEHQVFRVTAGKVMISGLTIRNGGGIGNFDGGNILNQGDLTIRDCILEDAFANNGGAVWSSGSLTIADSIIRNHGGVGAVTNYGNLSVTRTTFTANGAGGVQTYGEGLARITDTSFHEQQSVGLYNFGNLALERVTVTGSDGPGIVNGGTIDATNCTISGNNDAAIRHYSGSIALNSCTVADNFADTGSASGIDTFEGATVTLRNTILARHNRGNCGNNVVSLGHNVDDDGSCQLNQPSDKSNVADAGLGTLSDNGGPTMTHALLPGSPAIDAGDAVACPATDQRGIGRAGTCDIGAYELNVPTPTITPSPTETATRTATPVPSATATFSATQATTHTATATATVSQTLTPSLTRTLTPTHSATITPTETATTTSTRTATRTPTPIMVTSLNDSGAGSLRLALLVAPAGGQIHITVPGTINLDTENGNLLINKNITIRGMGAMQSHIQSNGFSRVFHVMSGNVKISDLALLSGGGDGTGIGGAIYNQGTLELTGIRFTGNTASTGGAIYNEGTLTIRTSVLENNNGTGAIANAGDLTVVDTDVRNNTNGGIAAVSPNSVMSISGSTIGDNSGRPGITGANIGAATDGTLTLINSTVSGNLEGGIGGAGPGYNDAFDGPVSLTNCTIYGNLPKTGAAGGIHASGTITLQNTIVANHPRGNCAGTIVSNGHNIDDDATCDLDSATDHSGVANAGVAPLANNSGPTRTNALNEGSPAIHAGDPTSCPPTDQRGVARIGACDIGAYEYTGPFSNGTPTPTATPIDLDLLTVTNLSDSGLGSLRYAMVRSDPGATIQFAPGLNGTVNLVHGDLRIDKDLTIVGPGTAAMALTGDGYFQLLDVIGGNVSVSGLRLGSGGNFGGNRFSAIANAGSLSLTDVEIINNAGAAAIHNDDFLSISDAFVSGNATVYAISNAGVLEVKHTTITDNQRIVLYNYSQSTSFATISDSAIIHNSPFYEDGALQNWGTLDLINTTLSDNRGGGVRNMAGTTNLINCTVADNPASSGFGIGLNNSGGSIIARNTIVAAHPRGNCGGTITSLGHNLDDDTTCGFNNDGDISGAADAGLDMLGNYGGATDTHALLAGSPAIDGGNPLTCPATDQRGYDRNGTCDIGAYELDGSPP